MKLALVILLALNVLPTAVNGHAELLYPMSRNVDEARKIQSGYCPHCGQSGGTALVAKRLFETDSDFPTEYQIPSAEGTHGLCGDPFQSLAQANGFLEPIANQPFMTPGDVKATFVEGDVVELQIGVSTNHKGFFEFKICDEVLDTNTESQVAGQACLDKYTLVRPDPANRPECEGVSLQANPDCQPLDLDYPTRWYLPPDAYASPAQGYPHHPIFKMKYQLPPGLKCEKCTMQWWWLTANSCHPKGEREWRAYMTSLNVPGAWTFQSDMSECSRSSQTEQFWNCADIRILPFDGTFPPEPTPQPEVPETTEAEEPEAPTPPAPPQQECTPVAAWGACDESSCCKPIDWSGQRTACYRQSQWNAQCLAYGACTGGLCQLISDLVPGDLVPGPPAPPSTSEPEPDSTPAPEPDTTEAEPETTEAEPETTEAEPETTEAEPETTPGPEEPQPVEGCTSVTPIGVYEECTGQHSGCCAEGLVCFVQDDKYAQCREPGTCPECAWDCTPVAPPCSEPVGKYGNCRDTHCCGEGLVCYEQDDGYAQCLEPHKCPDCDQWTCEVLLPGLPFLAPIRRRSAPALPTSLAPAAPAQAAALDWDVVAGIAVGMVGSVLVVALAMVALTRSSRSRTRTPHPEPPHSHAPLLHSIASQP